MKQLLNFGLKLAVYVGFAMPLWLSASHLVGGDLRYEQISGSTYRVILDIYRDCNSSVGFDRPSGVTIGVFNRGTTAAIGSFTMTVLDSFQVPITSSDPCAPPPSGLCYFRGVYTAEISLTVPAEGLVLSWGRCCRNPTITNIDEPGSTGMLLSCEIPPVANSAPAFNERLPMYTCVGNPVSFDFSTTDANGDSVGYVLVLPFLAGDTNSAIPAPVAPPFTPVQFMPGYTSQIPLGSGSAFSLNKKTGLLTMTPNTLGQFVFAVGVEEFRNGNSLGTLRRDVQINIVTCPVNVAPTAMLSLTGENKGDTMIFRAGKETCQSLRAQDVNGIGFGVDSVFVEVISALPGTVGPPATFSYTPGLAPRTATLCWTPNCNETQPTGSIRLRVRDNSLCPSPNIVEKEFFYRVLPPVPDAPLLRCVSVPEPDSPWVDLTWILPDSQANPVGVVVERDAGTGFVPVDLLAWGTTTWRDLNADRTNGTTYRYRLRTVISCPQTVESEPSNELGLLYTVVASTNGKIAQIEWSDYTRSHFSDYTLTYTDTAGQTGVEGIFAGNSHTFVPCTFTGTMRVATTDSLSGCTVLAVPTDTFTINNNVDLGLFDLCGVTVENGHPVLRWPQIDPAGVLRYNLLRAEAGKGQFAVVVDTMLANLTEWPDLTADPAKSWCYKLRVTDPCGNTYETDAHCTAVLTGKNMTNNLFLDWKPYQIISPSRGITTYEIWLTTEDGEVKVVGENEIDDLTFSQSVSMTSSPFHCYRVAAVTEASAGCGLERWFSNEVCFTFDPVIIIPDIFTPNGDSRNDALEYRSFFVKDLVAQVFDRWGHEVWSTTSPDEYWTGMVKGELAPEGVYSFRLAVTAFDGTVRHYLATVVLVR